MQSVPNVSTRVNDARSAPLSTMSHAQAKCVNPSIPAKHRCAPFAGMIVVTSRATHALSPKNSRVCVHVLVARTASMSTSGGTRRSLRASARTARRLSKSILTPSSSSSSSSAPPSSSSSSSIAFGVVAKSVPLKPDDSMSFVTATMTFCDCEKSIVPTNVFVSCNTFPSAASTPLSGVSSATVATEST